MKLSAKHLLILSGLLLSCGRLAFCQLPDYTARLFDERFGIRGEIQWVTIDQTDFVWLATSNRIFRFDGKQTREFTFKERIRSLECDMHNQIWTNTSSGVYIFKNDYEGFKPVVSNTSGETDFGNVFVLPGKELYLHTNKDLLQWNSSELSFHNLDIHKWGLPQEWDVPKVSGFGKTVFLSSKDSMYAVDIEQHTYLSIPRINNQGGMYAISDHEIIVTGRSNISSWCNFETGLIQPINPKNNIDPRLTEF
ncbi:MAG TPA: hypothetical protein VFV79_00700, partial [Saprospiraceae bacterium]|nr:hypothetical protein [Saprospiraceae bacterium]